jgi:hypothetical protein
MKRFIPFFYFFGSMLFVGSLCFIMGKAYNHDKDIKLIETLQQRDVSNYINDGAEGYLDGNLIDIPDEISTVSWYDDPEFDLMFVYKDDAGDIHLGFTGKTISRDSLHLDEMDTREHGELQPITQTSDIAAPISYK